MTFEHGVIAFLVGMGVAWGTAIAWLRETRQDVREIKQFLGIGNGDKSGKVVSRIECKLVEKAVSERLEHAMERIEMFESRLTRHEERLREQE